MKTFLSMLVSVLVAARHGMPTTEEDMSRYRQIAEIVVRESALDPLWGEPVALDEESPVPSHVAATATLLWAIGFHESGMRESVRRCGVKGDHGRSVGLFQLQRGWTWGGHEQGDICASDALQVRLALRVLKTYKSMNRGAPPRFWINGYASGDGGHPTRASKELRDLWERFSARAGLRVYPASRLAPSWRQDAPARPAAVSSANRPVAFP
ncbi:MAG: hypothetical protein MUF34_09175 [Polyangiaceae bacterium]|jgi:hypothetical protein|nr:hypothetical protein [Polyangiaceae bacterium]